MLIGLGRQKFKLFYSFLLGLIFVLFSIHSIAGGGSQERRYAPVGEDIPEFFTSDTGSINTGDPSQFAGVPVGCRHLVNGGTQQQLNDCIRTRLAGTPVGCRGLVRSGASQADINACIQTAGMPVGCRHLGGASQQEINECVRVQLAGLPVNCRGLYRSGASQADLNACVEINMASVLRTRAVSNAKEAIDEQDCSKDDPKEYWRCLQRGLGVEGATEPKIADLERWTPEICSNEGLSNLDRADAGCEAFEQIVDVSCRGLNIEEAFQNGGCYISSDGGASPAIVDSFRQQN